MDSTRRKILALASVLAALAPAAGGDELVIKVGKGSIPLARVVISRVGANTITYRVSGGSTVTKSLANVKKITLTGLESFNQAEELMTRPKPDPEGAIRAYDAVAADEGQSWLKDLVRYRRLEALVRAGRVRRATEEWLAIMDDEGASEATAGMVPKVLAPKGSTENAEAIKVLEAKLQAVRENKVYAGAARQMLMRLYRHEGRTAEADKLATMLAGGTAKPPGPKPNGNGNKQPPTVAVAADQGALSRQLDADAGLVRPGQNAKALRAALTRIKTNMPRYDEERLSLALLVAGKAQKLLAAKETDPKNKRKLLLSAGLDLMRVVAYYPSSLEAPEALYEAAGVNAALGNRSAARNAYNEIINRYGGNKSFVEKAKAARAALRPTGKTR